MSEAGFQQLLLNHATKMGNHEAKFLHDYIYIHSIYPELVDLAEFDRGGIKVRWRLSFNLSMVAWELL